MEPSQNYSIKAAMDVNYQVPDWKQTMEELFSSNRKRVTRGKEILFQSVIIVRCTPGSTCLLKLKVISGLYFHYHQGSCWSHTAKPLRTDMAYMNLIRRINLLANQFSAVMISMCLKLLMQ